MEQNFATVLKTACEGCNVCPLAYKSKRVKPLLYVNADAVVSEAKFLAIGHTLPHVGMKAPTSYNAKVQNEAHKDLADIFGETWMQDGEVIYTNAVRCPSPDATKDSFVDLLESCRQWNILLRESFKVVILIGPSAQKQMLGEKAEKLVDGEIVSSSSLNTLILPLKPVELRTDEDVRKYKRQIKKLKEKML